MASQSTLRLTKFPMSEMKRDKIILVVGRRGTGKSTLVKDILFHNRKKLDTGFMMTPTYDTQEEFRDCFPDSHIYNEYSIETVKNIIQTAESLKQQGKERHLLLVADDCMYEKRIMKSTEMRNIHMNGRHLNVMFVNSVQYLMDIGPDLRGQIDYVFCLREATRSTREKLHKYFFGIFDKFSEFGMVMDRCTNNREALVLDNTQTTNKIEDCVYFYKANPNIGKFRIGRSIYYKLDYLFKKNNTGQNTKNRTKLPEPIKMKYKIDQVQKEDTDDEK